MANILPFKGYRPPSKLAKIVSSPPYDVMSSDEARIMAKDNPISFLRIIKPEIDFLKGKEPEGNQLHKQSLINLEKFISNGKLIQDKSPCLYVYQIKMDEHIQTGIMAAVSIKEYNDGLIKKHEYTRPDKENDRTHHVEITNANTGPVFLTYKNDGRYNSIIKNIVVNKPSVSFKANDETNHTIWKVDDQKKIEEIQNYFSQISNLYIADGHHRAASASRVQKIKQRTNSNHIGDEAYNYFLSVIFPEDQMQILDYNRVIKDLNGLSEESFLEKIGINFSISNSSIPKTTIKPFNFSLFLNDNWYSMKIKKHIDLNHPVNGLEASILQNYLLSPILDIDDPRTNSRIDFIGGIRGMKEIEKRCQNDYKVGFALPPVKIEQLLAVADSGEVMPPKSTWFEPKLRSGMVVRLFN